MATERRKSSTMVRAGLVTVLAGAALLTGTAGAEAATTYPGPPNCLRSSSLENAPLRYYKYLYHVYGRNYYHVNYVGSGASGNANCRES